MANYTPGAGALWAQTTAQEIPVQFASTAPGLAAAKAALVAGGALQLPDVGVALGAGWANIGLWFFDAQGRVYISRFHMADGTDPTKRMAWDASAITTATIRTAILPNYGGFVLLPPDMGVSGRFLKSVGGGQPVWDVVPATQNNLLDGVNHLDTVAQAAVRGHLIVGVAGAPNKWDRLAIGGANTVLFSNGTDPSWVAASTVAALTQHDLLLHLKPITVTNCSWANGSATITTTSNFNSVKVGDLVVCGDFHSINNTGRRVTVWTDSTHITVSNTNGSTAISNQTMVFIPGDHVDYAMALDSIGSGGGGYMQTCSPGDYANGPTGTGTTFQELRGPIRWMGHASGSVTTDFRVNGSTDNTTDPAGFCIRRQGTNNHLYFYMTNITSNRIWSAPNASGVVVLDTATQTLSNKTLSTINKIEMDGTAAATVFTLPAAGGDRLSFLFTSMSALRVATWPDYSANVVLSSNVGSAGQVLTSNGAGVAPSYQAAGASSGVSLGLVTATAAGLNLP